MNRYYDPRDRNVYLGGDDCTRYDIIQIINHEFHHKILFELIDNETSTKWHNLDILEAWLFYDGKNSENCGKILTFREGLKDLKDALVK